MSLLIKGADISPDHIQCITVFPEGFAIVEEYDWGLPIKTTKCEVAPVPTSHGRLIDADVLKDRIDEADAWVLGAIDRSSTVIEAEEGEG